MSSCVGYFAKPVYAVGVPSISGEGTQENEIKICTYQFRRFYVCVLIYYSSDIGAWN